MFFKRNCSSHPRCRCERNGKRGSRSDPAFLWVSWYRRIPKAAMLSCGIVLLLGGKMVRSVCGSPWGTRAVLLLGDCLPSVFWMTLLWGTWYFLLGAAFGLVMFSEACCGVISFSTVSKYRGGMFFVSMILLGFLWYPLFFVAARFALCALLCLVLTCLAVLTGWQYWHVSKLAGVLLFVHALFLVWCSAYSIYLVLSLA